MTLRLTKEWGWKELPPKGYSFTRREALWRVKCPKKGTQLKITSGKLPKKSKNVGTPKKGAWKRKIQNPLNKKWESAFLKRE